MRESKKAGKQIGNPKGSTYKTKKAAACKSIIQKHAKDFGGTLDDKEIMTLCKCSRTAYYKYKRELKLNIA